MNSMFEECSSLREIDLSNFNANKLINKKFMFNGCSTLKKINIRNFRLNDSYNTDNVFSGCFSLEEIISLGYTYRKGEHLIIN